MLNENGGGMKMFVCVRVGIRANKFLPFDLASGDLSILTMLFHRTLSFTLFNMQVVIQL